MAMAQQMMQQPGFVPPTPGTAPAAPVSMAPGSTATTSASAPPPLPDAGGLPELLSPAEAAQALGVSEADVISTLEAGDLKGKKLGTTWRITRTALNEFLQFVTRLIR